MPLPELPKELTPGPKLLACSPQERLFVWFYTTDEDGNATEAARKAGYVDNDNGAIRVRAHALMHRDRVLEAIEEVSKSVYRAQLPLAVRANRKMLDKPEHPDHYKAVQSTLARNGLAERTAVDVNVGGTVHVNHTDAALEALEMMLRLRVPREVLVEHFGYSGLERYEKMLAGRAPKVIEHQSASGG